MIYFWYNKEHWWFGPEKGKQVGPFPTWDDLLVAWFHTQGLVFIPKHLRKPR